MMQMRRVIKTMSMFLKEEVWENLVNMVDVTSPRFASLTHQPLVQGDQEAGVGGQKGEGTWVESFMLLYYHYWLNP